MTVLPAGGAFTTPAGTGVLKRSALGASLLLLALSAMLGLVQGVASAKPAQQYLLKHPKRQHCRAGYAKRSKSVKVREQGRTVKRKETFCVYLAGRAGSKGLTLVPIEQPPAPAKSTPAQANAEANATAAYRQEFAEADRVGEQAYIYTAPLLDLQSMFLTDTSVNVPDHTGHAPVNQFSHFTALSSEIPGPLAPDPETLYSQGWLELGQAGPIVLHVPATPGRLSVVPLYSPYEENFANIGEGASGMLPPGNYVVAGPNQLAGQQQTDGMDIIHSPYDRVWVLPRTLVTSEQDLASAIAIQAEMKLVPLSRWEAEGLSYEPPAPETEDHLVTTYHPPGTELREDALVYWSAAAAALKQFEPPSQDAEELALIAGVGVGPGMSPTNDPNLGAGFLAGLRAAVRDGSKAVTKLYRERLLAGFEEHNGWGLEPTGEYGTDYDLRAIIDQFGSGALDPNVALYLSTAADRTDTPLNGAASRYVAHYPASDFPVPVQGFWSLTMYSTSGSLVLNSLHRYSIGGNSELHFEADGSLNIYLQTSEPGTAQGRENWLPAPPGPFSLVLRMYGPEEPAIAPLLEGAPGGWTPPTILPCLEDGQTAEGIGCTS